MIDHTEEGRVMTQEDVDNAKRYIRYLEKRIGTRLDHVSVNVFLAREANGSDN